jgi:hypothetical protein
MRQPVVIDGRNLYDPQEMADRGITYWGVGRGNHPILKSGEAYQPATVSGSNGVVSHTTSDDE